MIPIATWAAHHIKPVASIPWYLAGGQIALSDVIAAWNFKDPINYANDLVGSLHLTSSTAGGTIAPSSTGLVLSGKAIYTAYSPASFPLTLFLYGRNILNTASCGFGLASTVDVGTYANILLGTTTNTSFGFYRGSWELPNLTFESVTAGVGDKTGCFVMQDGNSANARLYVNGSLEDSTPSEIFTGISLSDINRIGLGGLVRSSPILYPGTFYNAALYSSALTASQVAALHTATS